MSATLRFWLAAFLAVAGSLAVYVGALANAIALGVTLGDLLVLPGIALVGTSPLPVRKLSLRRWQSVFLVGLRYLSAPVFLLGLFTLAPAVATSLGANAKQVHGLYFAVLLTAAGFLAITWPEFLWVTRRRRDGQSIHV